MKGYYFITDAGLSKRGNLSDVQNAVDAGVTVVQYRNKTYKSKDLYEEASVLREICRDIMFLINDRIDIALAVGADGAHLGQNDLPYHAARKLLGDDAIIGMTVHSVDEAIAAEEIGATYLGVSPIFFTRTKEDIGKPGGIELVRDVRTACTIPIIAIGGINLENAPEVIDAGADMICAISKVVCSDDVQAEVRKFEALFNK